MPGLKITIGKLAGKLGGKPSDEPAGDDMGGADLDGLAQDILDSIAAKDKEALKAALQAFCVSCD